MDNPINKYSSFFLSNERSWRSLTKTLENNNDHITMRAESLQLAKEWIQNADSVLICGAAGMSVKEGEMVYVNEDDFAKFYPYFLKWGYKHSYQGMGLMFDPSVPETAKWGYWADHIINQRWRFQPNDGYKTLLNMVKDKDYFVLTSNADGCFERSGFEVDRIYTPQGDWAYYQCLRPCRPDSVFESKEMLEDLRKNRDDEGLIPEKMIPRCKHCGGTVFGNVRFGSEYLHIKYQEQNDIFRRWMEKKVVSESGTVAIIEIGAGFNTPIVTRFPMESFARDLGERGKFIRINPSDPQVPSDLNALSIDEGWEVLNDIESTPLTTVSKQVEEEIYAQQKKDGKTSRPFGYHGKKFAWDEMLKQLKD